MLPTRITILIAALLALPAFAQPKPVDAFEQNRRLGRGVNVIGYDPLWQASEPTRFQAKHFRLLKEAGFNSVRINLHPFRHMGPAPDYALKASWFKTLDWAVEETGKAGLLAILDMHEFNTMGEAPEANHDKFLAFWRQLAAHCQNAPDRILFEILNEPNKKLTAALWNDYAREALAIIRQTNPTRNVIIGPTHWNAIDHLKELQLPAADRHIIVTVHYYKPMDFTHQGASWSSSKDKSNVAWLGNDAERQALKRDFDQAAAWAKQNQRPIFVGEFGAYDKAPMDSRARYTDAVARLAESLGWSWAYWQFDKDFVLYDIPKDAWVEPILHALIPQKH